jgi:small subunit ribosomal protein S20
MSWRGLRTITMANIHSQKKRILRSERERLENRRYTSTIKTLFRRLETLAEGKETAEADTTHRELVSTIDKAVKRGAMHKNTGARKKSRAARVLASRGPARSGVLGRSRAKHATLPASLDRLVIDCPERHYARRLG